MKLGLEIHCFWQLVSDRWQMLGDHGTQGGDANPEKVRAKKGGVPKGGPKISLFFSSSRLKFHSVCSLWASSRSISEVFEMLVPSKLHVWSSLAMQQFNGQLPKSSSKSSNKALQTAAKAAAKHPTKQQTTLQRAR